MNPGHPKRRAIAIAAVRRWGALRGGDLAWQGTENNGAGAREKLRAPLCSSTAQIVVSSADVARFGQRNDA